MRRDWKIAPGQEKTQAQRLALQDSLFSDRVWADADLMVIGIDPGRSGGLAVLNDNTEESAVAWLPTLTYIHPTKKTKAGKKARVIELDSHRYRLITSALKSMCELRASRFIFCIERQQTRGKDSGDGVVGVSSLMFDYGMLVWIPYGQGWDVRPVQPSVWMGKLGLKKGEVGKRGSVELANKLFPKADLPLVKDHNRAEALLIAHYARLFLSKEG
jgi:hypothetical protein